MRKLLLVNCVEDIEKVLKYIGVDDDTEVILVGHRCSSSYIVEDVDPRDFPNSIARVISRAKEFNKVRFAVFGREGLQSASIVLSYLVLSTVEDLTGLDLSPLIFVIDGRVYEYDLKARLYIGGSRGLNILKSLRDKCVDSSTISLYTGIPVATVRRRLSNMVKHGLINSYRDGRKNIYCLTSVGKAFTSL